MIQCSQELTLTPQSDEDRLKLNDLIEFYTKLQQRVLDLENTKTAQSQEITSLKLRVKKLEKKVGSRTHKLKRLYKPNPAYDFFAPAPLPGYAGNPNNNNGWLAADDYLLGELKAMVDEQMVVHAVDEIVEQMVMPAVEEVVELVVGAEEEQVIALVVDVVEGQMDAPMIDMEEDLAVLFGDDDFEDDALDGFSEEEVWEVNEDWLMAPTTPPPVLAVPPPSIYEVGGPSTAVAEGPSFPQVAPRLPVPSCMIEDWSTCLDNLEYGHGQLVQRVIQGSDAEIAAGVTIGEIGLRVLAVKGQIQVMASQMIQAVDRVDQVSVQVELGQQTSTQRDETITGLTQQVQALQVDVQHRDTQIQ
ncbi:hypothetical protein Tco_0407613 [Tanacetum coccineum]